MSTKKYNVKKQKRKSFTRSKNKRRSKRTKTSKVKKQKRKSFTISKNKRRSKRTKKFKVKRKLYGGSEAAAVTGAEVEADAIKAAATAAAKTTTLTLKCTSKMTNVFKCNGDDEEFNLYNTKPNDDANVKTDAKNEFRTYIFEFKQENNTQAKLKIILQIKGSGCSAQWNNVKVKFFSYVSGVFSGCELPIYHALSERENINESDVEVIEKGNTVEFTISEKKITGIKKLDPPVVVP